MLLNSRTSGVDGSSEGGRINTERLTNTLALFATALVDDLRSHGYAGKVSVRPDLEDGIPVLIATFPDTAPDFLPQTWQGRRVLAEKEAPPPPPAAPPAP